MADRSPYALYRDPLFWAGICLFLATFFWFRSCNAEPVRFEVETGVVWFKWDVDDEGILPLELAPPKWYVEPQFSWRPPKARDLGLTLVVGFRWQALGKEVRGSSARVSSWNYIDGPKIGIRGSWALTP